MKKLILLFYLIPSLVFADNGGGAGSRVTSEAQHPLRHKANRLPTDTTNFNNNLSPTDDNVQTALDTIDNLSLGSGSTSFSSTTPQGVLYIQLGNTAASSSLIVSDGSNLSIGIGTTANKSTLYIKGNTGTIFPLRVANSAPVDVFVITQAGDVGIG